MSLDMPRRGFIETLLAFPLLTPWQSGGGAAGSSPVSVAAGADRFGEARSLGISTIQFKVATEDAGGGLFVLENVFHAKGGPARHLHYEQDEWFYIVEGEFLFEIGTARSTLRPGDSLLAPRKVPHVWAHVGSGTGRVLVGFTPAGKMEAFFREVTKAGAMPPQDPKLWQAHGMELLGPPLKV
jgi:mannose-6-phosphate isomerase-like protein (cupin superfamily)